MCHLKAAICVVSHFLHIYVRNERRDLAPGAARNGLGQIRWPAPKTMLRMYTKLEDDYVEFEHPWAQLLDTLRFSLVSKTIQDHAQFIKKFLPMTVQLRDGLHRSSSTSDIGCSTRDDDGGTDGGSGSSGGGGGASAAASGLGAAANKTDSLRERWKAKKVEKASASRSKVVAGSAHGSDLEFTAVRGKSTLEDSNATVSRKCIPLSILACHPVFIFVFRPPNPLKEERRCSTSTYSVDTTFLT